MTKGLSSAPNATWQEFSETPRYAWPSTALHSAARLAAGRRQASPEEAAATPSEGLVNFLLIGSCHTEVIQ